VARHCVAPTNDRFLAFTGGNCSGEYEKHNLTYSLLMPVSRSGYKKVVKSLLDPRFIHKLKYWQRDRAFRIIRVMPV
jgi:hypothetical protein